MAQEEEGLEPEVCSEWLLLGRAGVTALVATRDGPWSWDGVALRWSSEGSREDKEGLGGQG